MSLYFDISRYPCPNCTEIIEVNKIQDFSTRLGKRNSFNCPECETTLNWEKVPHHLAHYSLWCAFLTFPIPFAGLYSFSVGIWVLGACLLASATGMMMQRLVKN